MVGVEFGSQQPQETRAPRFVQRQVGAAELGGARPRGDLAAAAIETAEHLLAQPRDVVLGQIRPRRARQDAARRQRDLAPRAA